MDSEIEIFCLFKLVSRLFERLRQRRISLGIHPHLQYVGMKLPAVQYAHGAGQLELWADIDGRRITAILDGYDGLRKHTAILSLKVSREWAEWSHIDGKLFPQADFAEFIADHLSTIAAPDGALLVDICETLTGKTDCR